MISSNSYELRLDGLKGARFVGRRDALELPCTEADLLPVAAEEVFAIAVRRPAPARARLRLRLGSELIAEVPAGRASFETEAQPWLRNEFGESCLALEQEREDEPDEFDRLWEVGLAVTPRPEVLHDFRVMMEEVAEVHEGLAHDMVSRAFMRKQLRGAEVSRLHPEAVLKELLTIYGRMEAAVAQIARQPSVMLDRSARLARYRGGDRLDARAAAHAARDPGTRFGGGRVASLGRVRVRVPALTEDLPEHRHIAEGIRRLADRARGLARHCERSADLLRQEEAHWGGTRPGAVSVFEQRDLPRVAALDTLAGQARGLADAFTDLWQRHRFLREAGPPRTALAPTPAFLGRAAYRAAYRLLVQAR
ncbi:MAG TPA: DUF2357 domain-containing protein, partial [Gemmataceae bacterium]|nr:DUF2357 domain-containing protein [Gemmataceae bacterium]